MWALLLAALAWSAEPAAEAGPLFGPVPPPTDGLSPAHEAAAGEAALAPHGLLRSDAPAGEAESEDPLAWLDELERDGRIGAAPPAPRTPWWIPAVALAGAGAFYWTRRQRAALAVAPPPAAELRVLSRAALGGSAGVALVEVGVDGTTRRLVLGLGGGAPALLVDLGAVVPRAVAPAAAAPAPSAPERPRRMAIEDDEDLPTSPPVRLSRRFPDELLDAMPDEPPAPRRPSARPESLAEVAAALAPRKAAAHKLIDETLATRRAAGGRS